jgi:hypothetical protein
MVVSFFGIALFIYLFIYLFLLAKMQCNVEQNEMINIFDKLKITEEKSLGYLKAGLGQWTQELLVLSLSHQHVRNSQ